MEKPVASAAQIAELKRTLRQHVLAFRVAEADELCSELIHEHGVDGEADDMLPSRVAVDIFNGRLQDTICMLNGIGDDRALGLKAVCLRLLGDPYWEGTAMQAQAYTDDPVLKKSMQSMLDTASGA